MVFVFTLVFICLVFFFFFSSRRRHTRLQGDWSSDVCSSDVCFMPWVRLHAVRSYYDMIRVLEEFPGIRPTFNLTATLIEQIRAYEAGATDLFRETARIPPGDLDESRRAFLFEHFFAAQVEHMIGDLPRYAEIHARRERAR